MKTKNIEHVAVMSVVNAAGVFRTPVVVFPGKKEHYRVVSGRLESLHDHPMPWYLFLREVAREDSIIFASSASYVRWMLIDNAVRIYYSCMMGTASISSTVY